MRFLNTTFVLFTSLVILTGLSACKKKEKDVIYGVNEAPVETPNANKTKLKSNEQYLSIIYANLFQQALPSNQLVELTNLVESCGDKDVIREIIISNFMNKGNVIIPTNAEMRQDIDLFIEETYTRFMVRPPSELEKTYFRNYIEGNDKVSPELVYFAFALSNEYQFY